MEVEVASHELIHAMVILRGLFNKRANLWEERERVIDTQHDKEREMRWVRDGKSESKIAREKNEQRDSVFGKKLCFQRISSQRWSLRVQIAPCVTGMAVWSTSAQIQVRVSKDLKESERMDWKITTWRVGLFVRLCWTHRLDLRWLARPSAQMGRASSKRTIF